MGSESSHDSCRMGANPLANAGLREKLAYWPGNRVGSEILPWMAFGHLKPIADFLNMNHSCLGS